ncbi:uncharacterized protein LOC128956947 [Oppia nitens]|uniref:uncharacterized protein LOC128956947 n=1 Tax=Oppia nitens TaxID=1686743 RepID=UPI0023DA3B77|nr:uncharacterized protein LOC128956947 [Oppia nitens]
MTTTTKQQESYVVYSLTPDPFPDDYTTVQVVGGSGSGDGSGRQYDLRDKHFATTICLSTIIASVVLICLWFLLGAAFGYILMIILLVLIVMLIIVYWTRRPAILFPTFRTSSQCTSVKFPNTYAMHVLPGPQLPHVYNNNNNKQNSNLVYYPYPAPGAATYATTTSTKQYDTKCKTTV